MVELDLHQKFRRRVENFSASQVAAIEEAIENLRQGFGQPHLHSGLGVRKLRRNLYECRAGRDLRILFWAQKGTLIAFDIMTHDEIQAFLRNF